MAPCVSERSLQLRFRGHRGLLRRAHNVVEGVGEVCFVILDVGMATILGGRGVRALVLGWGATGER